MELHRRSADRVLRVERGSAIVEGIAALGIAFLLLALVVQVAFAATARNAAEAAVAASARRAARTAVDIGHERAALAQILAQTVPGARDPEVGLARDETAATATARFRWDPPGPAWLPITIRVAASAPLVTPP